MSVLTKEVIDLINDPNSLKILATSDEYGRPLAVTKGCLTVIEDGNLAFAEAFEGSQTNINLVRSTWFEREVTFTISGKDGVSFTVRGRPYKFTYNGPLYKKFYQAARRRRGADSELAGVWIIQPLEVRNDSYAFKKKNEDARHPFFRHFDRESLKTAASSR